jgi:hypothetical protein
LGWAQAYYDVEENPYVPLNSPTLGDLFDMFHFNHDCDNDQ